MAMQEPTHHDHHEPRPRLRLLPGLAPQPCTRCGGPKALGRGRRLCESCTAHDEARRLCRHCGAEKGEGQGRVLCEPCAVKARQPSPCHACGEPTAKGTGERFCRDCAPVVHDVAQRRRRARVGLKRKPCRGCGRPKGPGSRRIYCDACRAKREAPRTCARDDCERPVTEPHKRYCEPCRVVREREFRLERQRRYYERRIKADPEGVADSRRVASARYAAKRRARPNYPHPVRRRLGAVSAGPLIEKVIKPMFVKALHEVDLEAPDWTDPKDIMRASRGGANRHQKAGQMGPTQRIANLMGTSERTVYAWLQGERQSLHLATLDTALQGCEINWFEVYEPGDEGYAEVRLGIGGQKQ